MPDTNEGWQEDRWQIEYTLIPNRGFLNRSRTNTYDTIYNGDLFLLDIQCVTTKGGYSLQLYFVTVSGFVFDDGNKKPPMKMKFFEFKFKFGIGG